MSKQEILTIKQQEFNQASLEHWLPTEIRVLGLRRIAQGTHGEYPILELGFGWSGKENIRYALLDPMNAQTTGWQEEPIAPNMLFDTPFSVLDSLERFAINHSCSEFIGRKILVASIPQVMKDEFSTRIAKSLLNNVIFGKTENNR